MPLTDPVPSSSFDVLERNIQDTDKFVNQETGTFTNRVGKVIKPIPVIEAEALEISKSLGWTPSGEFATGFTYEKLNDVGRDSSGSWWRYNGSDLPKVIAAGTVPSSPDFSVISFETAYNVEWKAGKSVGYALDDLQGFTDELYAQASIVPSGQPDKLGASQRVEAMFALFASKKAVFKNIMSYIPRSQHSAIYNHISVYDCTADILAAIADFPNNTGAIAFPAGLFNTSQIDLRPCENITLLGANDATIYPYDSKGMTVIKAKSAGDAVILTATLDADSYATGNSCKISTIKNILVDANNLCKVGITTARGTTVDGCTVQNAIQDGITLEAGFFPVWIKNSMSRNNGRDGIRAKSPNSTIFCIESVEASYNQGNGITICDGSTGGLIDVYAQSNQGNGYSILYQDPSSLPFPIFLERLYFERCYSEANGSWGIYTDSFNTDPTEYTGKIVNLTFVNCSFNSGSGRNARLRGLSNTKIINSPYLSDALDPLYNTVLIDKDTIEGWSKPTAGLDLTSSDAGRILFPTVQNHSADPRTLDDYHKGEFTPVIEGASTSGTAAYSVQRGKFVKIGNALTFNVQIEWSGHTGTGPMRLNLNNMPYSNADILISPSVRYDGFIINGVMNTTMLELEKLILFWSQSQTTGINSLIDVKTSGSLRVSGVIVY